MSKINEITLIKDEMSKEEAKAAIKSFLSEVLSSDKLIKQEDISSKEITVDKSGFRGFQVIKLKDGSSWVVGAGGIERTIGASYLKIKLQESKLNGWEAVETKFCLKNESNEYITCQIKKSDDAPLKGIPTIMSDDVVTFSKYAVLCARHTSPALRQKRSPLNTK